MCNKPGTSKIEALVLLLVNSLDLILLFLYVIILFMILYYCVFVYLLGVGVDLVQ